MTCAASSLISWRASRTPRYVRSVRRPTWSRSSRRGRPSGGRPAPASRAAARSTRRGRRRSRSTQWTSSTTASAAARAATSSRSSRRPRTSTSWAAGGPRRALPRAARVRGVIAATGRGAAASRAPVRGARADDRLLRRVLWEGDGGGSRGARVPGRAGLGERRSKGVPARSRAGARPRREGARGAHTARRAAGGRPHDRAWRRLLPAAAHVPARGRPRGGVGGSRPASSTRTTRSAGSTSTRPRAISFTRGRL